MRRHCRSSAFSWTQNAPRPFIAKGRGAAYDVFIGRLRVDSGGVGQQIALGLGAPQAVVGGAQLGQLGEDADRSRPSRRNRRWRSAACSMLGVDQLLAAGNLGQVQRGFDDGVQAADMGDHARRESGDRRRSCASASIMSSVLPPAGAHDVRARRSGRCRS